MQKGSIFVHSETNNWEEAEKRDQIKHGKEGLKSYHYSLY
jgi:hypothetical protein